MARDDTRTLAQQVAHARRVMSLIVMLAGLMVGNGTAALVFYYDGTQPINVLPVLSVFVLLPMVLLFSFACEQCWSSSSRFSSVGQDYSHHCCCG